MMTGRLRLKIRNQRFGVAIEVEDGDVLELWDGNGLVWRLSGAWLTAVVNVEFGLSDIRRALDRADPASMVHAARIRAGLDRARERGKRLGRPAKVVIDPAIVRALLAGGKRITEVARDLGTHPTSIRRALSAAAAAPRAPLALPPAFEDGHDARSVELAAAPARRPLVKMERRPSRQAVQVVAKFGSVAARGELRAGRQKRG